ncbi:hypothetical protein TSUD_45940 [Trifolium subterraneum]|nr:hypothetical protein TSUD_45940 [Trifolium subterraneum]
MPVRQMKESSEQHIVIKTNLQNPKNQPKASQNGKASSPPNSVTITPEVSSRTVNRSIIAELVKLYKESDLGMRLPAYDGRKSLRVKEYRVVIKFVARANLHHLGQFLTGKRADAPHEPGGASNS